MVVRSTQWHEKLLARPVGIQQVKHHHNVCDADFYYTFHLGFWRTLVDLRWMPNDVNKARKWSGYLHFNCYKK